MKKILLIVAGILFLISCKDLESSNKYEAVLTEYENFADSVSALKIPSGGFTLEQTTQIGFKNEELNNKWKKLVDEAKTDDQKPSTAQLEKITKYSSKVSDKMIEGLGR